MISAGDVVEVLRRVKPGPAGWSSEKAYQRALETSLTRHGVRFRAKARSHGGEPDLAIEGCKPGILVEIKASGDWRNVAEAAAQLWIYREHFPDCHLVAALGTQVQHEVLREMLKTLSITLLEGSQDPGGR